MLRSFLKDSAIYSIPAFISRGLSLFFVPIYTRVLSPTDYGSLDLLTVFGGFVNLTIALEVSQGVARFYPSEQDPERKVAFSSSAFWFTFACYSIFALSMLAHTDSLAVLIIGQAGLESAFQISILNIWASGLLNLAQNQFRWELRSKEYATVSLLMLFVNAGISLLFTFGLGWGLEGLLLGMLSGSLIGTMLGLWWLRESFRFRFNSACLFEMLAFSTPLVFSGVAVWLSLYIDRLMINHFLTVEDVGLYGIGYRLASIAGLLMVGFQGALTPLIYTNYRNAETPRQLARIFRIFLFFALLLFLGLSLFTSTILQILVTPNFYGGEVVVFYLIPALFLSNMYIFAPGIGIAKRTHYLIWINAGGALLNSALNYTLIPKLGIVGAAFSTFFSYLTVFAVSMVLSQRLFRVPHRWGPIFGSVFAASLLGWWLPNLPLADGQRWILNLLALLVFSVIALALGLIRINELRSAKALATSLLYPQ